MADPTEKPTTAKELLELGAIERYNREQSQYGAMAPTVTLAGLTTLLNFNADAAGDSMAAQMMAKIAQTTPPTT